jgi:NADH-quinone oxidoreductase subunit N
MVYTEFFFYTFKKNLFNAVLSDVYTYNLGLFTNDLNFFYFEIFFLLSIVILLIFFVILSNKKIYRDRYLNVSNILLNLTLFIIIMLLLLLNNCTSSSYYLFAGFYYSDLSIVFFKNLMLITLLVFLFSVKDYVFYLKNYDFEFIIVLLVSLFSSLLILNSNDLISLFFILELQGLTFYILVSSRQVSSFSTEAGLKYFIMGCFSSGIILFGISLIYGFTGLLSYSDLSLFLSTIIMPDIQKSAVLAFSFNGFIVGLTLLTVGLLFKLGAVPFHM